MMNLKNTVIVFDYSYFVTKIIKTKKNEIEFNNIFLLYILSGTKMVLISISSQVIFAHAHHSIRTTHWYEPII